MQIVIDIPEYDYEHIKEIYEHSHIVEATYSYIYHGTPLPKGHGRLADIDALRVSLVENEWISHDDGGGLEDLLDDAQTIIEADKEESEDEYGKI